jgi:hypothetical protein
LAGDIKVTKYLSQNMNQESKFGSFEYEAVKLTKWIEMKKKIIIGD